MSDIVIFILISAAALLTVLTLLAGLRDRRALDEAGVNGTYQFWNFQDIRRDVLRLTKHLAVVFAVFVVIPSVREWLEARGVDVMNLRNYIFVFIGIEMGINSAWDLWARRKHRDNAPC